MSSDIERVRIDSHELQQENVRKILEAGGTILAQNHLEVGQKYRKAFVSAGTPIELFVNLGCLPHYAKMPNPTLANQSPIFSVHIELRSENNVSVSERLFHFYEPHDKQVVVYSHSCTEAGFESRGYGQGLFHLGHQLIQNLLELEHLRGKSVEAVIIDNAHGMQISKEREGWTKKMALSLGYEPYEPSGLIRKRLPTFRFKFQ